MSYVLKPPSKSKPPIGHRSLLFVLKKLNVPTELFGIHIRKKLCNSIGLLKSLKTPVTPHEPEMSDSGDFEDATEDSDKQEEHASMVKPAKKTFSTPLTRSEWQSY